MSSFKLNELRDRTPPVDPIHAARQSLALGLMDGLNDTDMTAIAQKLKEMALGGNLKAMQLLIELTGVKDAPPPPPAPEPKALQKLADAVEGLVNEVRDARSPQAEKLMPKIRRKALNGPVADEND